MSVLKTSDEYLSDSSSYSNSESDLELDDYNNYESNYKSDNEEALCTSISITETPLVQLSNIEQNAKIIHECINGQKSLRAVIDINAIQEDMEADEVKPKDILKGLVIAISSDSSKCSYHILYALVLLINHHELKAFTELIYTITGKKFGKTIDLGLPDQNFNFCLISLAKKDHVKCILQFSLDND
ncbi:hypothetical protein C1645_814795 [Glomus cerebriforme]|uniref:Uncharacterized protein n=1 Tax=Glomus cerebriforme TaxID=658196 RepID=A0A397TPI6_9GLOM|nr:hypothetical protein C1645_814795 [Glomus cerebriforme]